MGINDIIKSYDGVCVWQQWPATNFYVYSMIDQINLCAIYLSFCIVFSHRIQKISSNKLYQGGDNWIACKNNKLCAKP